MKRIYLAVVICLFAAFAAPAHAESINFTWRSSSGTVDISSQLTVDVTVTGSVASFRFLNDVSSGTSSSLTGVYFNTSLDNLLDFADAGTNDISDSGSGVNFTEHASPVAPGGTITWTSGWDMDRQGSGSAKGVDQSSEWVQVDIELLDGVTAAALLTELRSGDDIAVNVQGVLQNATDASGTSEWFETTGVTIIPEPAPVALVAFGLGCLLLLERRRRLVLESD